MSVADMWAMARGGAAAKPASIESPAETPVEEQPVAAAPVAKSAAPAEPASGEIKRVDKSKMSIEEMLAYCREHDAK
jgi:hypothetical protein